MVAPSDTGHDQGGDPLGKAQLTEAPLHRKTLHRVVRLPDVIENDMQFGVGTVSKTNGFQLLGVVGALDHVHQQIDALRRDQLQSTARFDFDLI